MQLGQVAKLRRYEAGQPVVLEIQSSNAAMAISNNAVPFAKPPVAQPVGIVLPVRSTGCVIPAASYRATSAALSGVVRGVPAAGVVAHVSPARSSISWSQAWNAESGGAQCPTLPWKWKDISAASSVRLDGSSPLSWLSSASSRPLETREVAELGWDGPDSQLVVAEL